MQPVAAVKGSEETKQDPGTDASTAPQAQDAKAAAAAFWASLEDKQNGHVAQVVTSRSLHPGCKL